VYSPACASTPRPSWLRETLELFEEVPGELSGEILPSALATRLIADAPAGSRTLRNPAA